jgi:hypothetical protein
MNWVLEGTTVVSLWLVGSDKEKLKCRRSKLPVEQGSARTELIKIHGTHKAWHQDSATHPCTHTSSTCVATAPLCCSIMLHVDERHEHNKDEAQCRFPTIRTWTWTTNCLNLVPIKTFSVWNVLFSTIKHHLADKQCDSKSKLKPTPFLFNNLQFHGHWSVAEHTQVLDVFVTCHHDSSRYLKIQSLQYKLPPSDTVLSQLNPVQCFIKLPCNLLLLNLNSVNQLIFVMVKCGVLFEVRAEFLNNI